MNTINLGTTIRKLRRKKGITQETLAEALSVSPQAVSKWESGLCFPDMSMIPVIAGYFEVSLDILFDFDVSRMRERISDIIEEARKYFFDETKKYEDMIKTALIDYPENEDLLSALLSGYEYDLRCHNRTDHLDEMIELSQKIISQSSDFIRVCSAKEDQAAAYLKKSEYNKAKEVLETLPDNVTSKYDAMSFRLSGKDKLNAAVWSRCGHLQSLYQACLEEGNAWFRMNEQDLTFRDYTPDDYIPQAMIAYRRGLDVLTAFLLHDYGYTGQDLYLWDGMQTFHYTFHQALAACHKKLGNIEECEKQIERAYEIISTSWNDFEEKRDEYMEYFNQYLKEYDLAEYVR